MEYDYINYISAYINPKTFKISCIVSLSVRALKNQVALMVKMQENATKASNKMPEVTCCSPEETELGVSVLQDKLISCGPTLKEVK